MYNKRMHTNTFTFLVVLIDSYICDYLYAYVIDYLASFNYITAIYVIIISYILDI